MLTPAAERLPGKYAAAAGLLYRRMAESSPAWASSRRDGYAARDVRNSASLAGPVADDGGIEGHGAFGGAAAGARPGVRFLAAAPGRMMSENRRGAYALVASFVANESAANAQITLSSRAAAAWQVGMVSPGD